MELLNLRNALMAGKKGVTFIEWLQSDGTGYVDLQYAPTDPETRMLITASTSTAASNYAPLVCSGMNTAMNDVTKPSFGFASINNDRQIYLKSARQHWWNTTANSGNWNDGNFHSIDIGQNGATSSTSSVDGQSISMERISTSTSGSMPTDTQTVFASKYNGEYYLKNSKFKVARIAYEVGGVIVHDFVAAKIDETFGFYDITTSKFIAGVGGLVAGPDIVPVEYIGSTGTQWIDTGFKANTTTTTIETSIELTSMSTTNAGLFGSRNNTSMANGASCNASVLSTGKIRLDWASADASLNIDVQTGVQYEMSVTQGRYVLNGTETIIPIPAQSYDQASNFLLFNFYNDTIPFSTGASVKMRYARLYSNSALVRKCLPVRVGTEGAMMDTLTRRIYRNAGTGAFTYGNDTSWPTA